MLNDFILLGEVIFSRETLCAATCIFVTTELKQITIHVYGETKTIANVTLSTEELLDLLNTRTCYPNDFIQICANGIISRKTLFKARHIEIIAGKLKISVSGEIVSAENFTLTPQELLDKLNESPAELVPGWN